MSVLLAQARRKSPDYLKQQTFKQSSWTDGCCNPSAPSEYASKTGLHAFDSLFKEGKTEDEDDVLEADGHYGGMIQQKQREMGKDCPNLIRPDTSDEGSDWCFLVTILRDGADHDHLRRDGTDLVSERLLKVADSPGRRLVSIYAECGSLSKAKEAFDSLPVRNAAAWNALITGYVQHGHAQEALKCFDLMQLDDVFPDTATYIEILKACGSIGAVGKGQEIHAHIVRKGFLENDIFLGTALVDMYGKCGLLVKAQYVFDKLPFRNVVSWSALIEGYTQHGHGEEALKRFEWMKLDGVSPNAVTFRCILKACGSIGATEKVGEIHTEIAMKGLLEKDVAVGTALVDVYVKCGLLVRAQDVFDKLPLRNVVLWSVLIAGYSQYGHGSQALKCFERMQLEGVSPDGVTFVSILKACASIGAIDKGQDIHSHIDKLGLVEKDVFIGTALLDMYAKLGLLAKAQEVFDKLPLPNVVSWSALIAGYTNYGHLEEALECFERMQIKGVTPNAVTFLCILKACGTSGAMDKIPNIQAEISRRGLLENNVALGTALIDVYAKNGLLSKAQEVFHNLPDRNIVSWSALISGYTHHGHCEQALDCFEQMQLEGVAADPVTFVSILKACGSLGATKKGQQMHTCALNMEIENDMFVGTALVDMYAKCALLAKAQEVFDKLPVHDVVLWSALIAGYAHHGHGEEALNCYGRMKLEDVSPNAVTFRLILKACGSIRAQDKGREIHADIVSEGLLEKDISIGNGLVDMYAKCGMLTKAQEVFDKLPTRDVVSWNALITGYVQTGHGDEALDCFERLQHEGSSPDAVTFVCILKACGSIGAIDKGRAVHADIIREGLLEKDSFIGNALVDMYSKCGLVAKAQDVFDKLSIQDVVSWNALIAGYGQLGKVESVFYTFKKMLNEGLKPDFITFTCVLNACSHTGLLDAGQMFFESMWKDFGFIPTLEHHTCMIDLLGRAGQLDKVVAVVKEMPFFVDLVVWLSVLGACRKLGNVELGRLAFEYALLLDEKCPAAYVLMSNIYSDAGRQEDAGKVDAMRVEKKAWQDLECCWWD